MQCHQTTDCIHSNLTNYNALTRYHHRFVWTTRMKRHLVGIRLRFTRNNIRYILFTENNAADQPLPVSARVTTTN